MRLFVCLLLAGVAAATICTSPQPYVIEPILANVGVQQNVPTSLLPTLAIGPSIGVDTTGDTMMAVIVANNQQSIVFAANNATAQTDYLVWVDSTTRVATANTAASFVRNSAFDATLLAVASNANVVYAVGSITNFTIISSVAPFALLASVAMHSTERDLLSGITCSPAGAAVAYLYTLNLTPFGYYYMDVYTTAATTGAVTYVKTIPTTVQPCTFCDATLSEIEGNLWLVSGAAGTMYQVVVYNVTTGRNITTIGGLSFPSHVVYDPVTRHVYINSQAGMVISIISAASFSIVETLVWTKFVNYIALHPSNPTQLIVADGVTAVVVFDVNKRTIVATAPNSITLSALLAVQPLPFVVRTPPLSSPLCPPSHSLSSSPSSFPPPPTPPSSARVFLSVKGKAAFLIRDGERESKLSEFRGRRLPHGRVGRRRCCASVPHQPEHKEDEREDERGARKGAEHSPCDRGALVVGGDLFFENQLVELTVHTSPVHAHRLKALSAADGTVRGVGTHIHIGAPDPRRTGAKLEPSRRCTDTGRTISAGQTPGIAAAAIRGIVQEVRAVGTVQSEITHRGILGRACALPVETGTGTTPLIAATAIRRVHRKHHTLKVTGRRIPTGNGRGQTRSFTKPAERTVAGGTTTRPAWCGARVSTGTYTGDADRQDE